MLNPEIFQRKQSHLARFTQLFALPDTTAAIVVAGIAVGLFVVFGVVPMRLREIERDDYRGTVIRSAPGQVAMLHISPVTMGGGGLYNAVTVEFAGRAGVYALKPSSKWLPRNGDTVQVNYRVGRKSGLVRIENVIPDAPLIAEKAKR